MGKKYTACKSNEYGPQRNGNYKKEQILDIKTW